MPVKPMTKAEIVSHFAEHFDMTKAMAAQMIDEYANLAASQTKKVGEFTMPGIGKISVSERKARTGRNPATGAEIKIPAKKVVKAKIAKAFQDNVVPTK